MTDSHGHILRKWLVLTHHLPPLPAYLRVKVRRRLERKGGVEEYAPHDTTVPVAVAPGSGAVPRPPRKRKRSR